MNMESTIILGLTVEEGQLLVEAIDRMRDERKDQSGQQEAKIRAGIRRKLAVQLMKSAVK